MFTFQGFDAYRGKNRAGQIATTHQAIVKRIERSSSEQRETLQTIISNILANVDTLHSFIDAGKQSPNDIKNKWTPASGDLDASLHQMLGIIGMVPPIIADIVHARHDGSGIGMHANAGMWRDYERQRYEIAVDVLEYLKSAIANASAASSVDIFIQKLGQKSKPLLAYLWDSGRMPLRDLTSTMKKFSYKASSKTERKSFRSLANRLANELVKRENRYDIMIDSKANSIRMVALSPI